MTKRKASKSKKNESGQRICDQLYFAERIEGKRLRRGKLQYYVKWQDWEREFNTWEPAEHLQNCEDLIEDFESRNKSSPTKRARLDVASQSSSSSSQQRSQDDETDSEDPEFSVRRIVDKRENDKKEVEYLVEWEGYPEEDRSWEPISNLQHCIHHVRDFEAVKAQEKRATSEVELTGFDRGWQAETILGATDVQGDMKFLIKWKGKNTENLVSNKIARKHVPQMIIKFYEDHTKWVD